MIMMMIMIVIIMMIIVMIPITPREQFTRSLVDIVFFIIAPYA